MKCIIAGSRTICDYDTVAAAIDASGFADEITEVVCGEARGVDYSGSCWGESRGIPIARFPADWYKRGLAAGPIRNEQMAKYADALILVWDGKSSGSMSMLNLARRYKLRIHEHIIKEPA